MRYAWFNDVLIPEKKAKLSVYDSALMFGDMAFEMTRTFNREVFKCHDHFERLRMSCEYLEIDVHYRWGYLETAYQDLIETNREEWREGDEVRGLINISRGILPMYARAGMGKEGVNIIMTCFPLRHVLSGMSWVYTKGVEVIIPRQQAIPERFLDAKIKSRSRQHYKMADIQAHKTNLDAWALLLDENGFVAEGTGSNFFIVKNGDLFTPRPVNCLRGISRGFIVELCELRGITCAEKDLTFYDIIHADEAFFTNTPYSIVPIRTIDGHELKECVGQMTEYLTRAWAKRVGVDFVAQARKWDKDENISD